MWTYPAFHSSPKIKQRRIDSGVGTAKMQVPQKYPNVQRAKYIR